MKRDVTLYMKDVIDSIDKIYEFIKGINYHKFLEDEKTNCAVVRKLEIIGEAVKNIPPQIRHNYPDIPWKEIAGMRDIISHVYFGIDYTIVWKVVKKRLPELKKSMQAILEEQQKTEGR